LTGRQIIYHGEIKHWINDDGIVQTGNEDFDRIAIEFEFIYMKRAFPFIDSTSKIERFFLCPNQGTRLIHSYVIRLRDDNNIREIVEIINNLNDVSCTYFKLTGCVFIQPLNCQRNKLYFSSICLNNRLFDTEGNRILFWLSDDDVIQTSNKYFNRIARNFNFTSMNIAPLANILPKWRCGLCVIDRRPGYSIRLYDYKKIYNAFRALYDLRHPDPIFWFESINGCMHIDLIPYIEGDNK
jgi:hypothetical protein